MAFAPGGDLLAAADHAGEIRVWDLMSDGEAPVATATNTGPIRALAFAKGGDVLAAGDEQGAVLLWRWRSAEPIPLGTHGRWVTGLAFTPDGEQLVSAGQDGTVRIWPASAQATVDLACVRAADAVGGTTTEEWSQSCPSLPVSRPVSARKAAPGSNPSGWSSPARRSRLAACCRKPARPSSSTSRPCRAAQVAEGDSVLLRWNLANAKEAYLYTGEDEAGVVAPDEKSVIPAGVTTYRLVARNDQGETVRTLTVTPVKPH